MIGYLSGSSLKTSSCWWGFLYCIVVGAVMVQAEPVITNVFPPAGQRGTTIAIDIRGRELLDPQDVVFYSEGLQLVDLEAIGDRHIRAHIAIADDCTPGPHMFRVCTGRGITAMSAMGVTDLSTILENEPNQGKKPAQAVSLPVAVIGTILPEDTDRYEFEMKAGSVVCCEILSLRLGPDLDDPVLRIRDQDDKIVASADDHPLTRQDSIVAFTAPKSGRYTVEIEDVLHRGRDRYHYLLTLGDIPRPTVVWPPGGRPGQEVELTFRGLGLPPFTSRVTLPVEESAAHDPSVSHSVIARDERGLAPSPNGIRVVDLPGTPESEPNDSLKQAVEIQVPGVVYGIIDQPKDQDHFRFSAKKDQAFEIEVFARRELRSRIDSWVMIRHSNGKYLQANDDNGGTDSYLEFRAPKDDEYLLTIRDQLMRGGTDCTYQIEIRSPQPSLTLSVPHYRRQQPTSIALPRGNRMAALMTVKRLKMSQAVQLEADGLPPGVTVTAPTIPAGRDRVPVIFEVAADAVRGGTLVGFTGTAQVGDATVTGQFYQRSPLVLGPNLVDMWGHDSDRLTVAVVDSAPFHLDLVVPTVPLVRNGSINLYVQARRQPGFNEPITLRPLYNPPGVASRSGVQIPKDAALASVPTTANGNAALGESPIVFVGSTRYQGVAYEVATAIVPLEVAEPLFDVKLARANIEQGGTAEMVVSVTPKREFSGTVEATLVGLPAGVTSSPLAIDAETKDLHFVLQAAATARVGNFSSVLCRIVNTPLPPVADSPTAPPASADPAQTVQTITQTIGGGRIRVDKPLVPRESPPVSKEGKVANR